METRLSPGPSVPPALLRRDVKIILPLVYGGGGKKVAPAEKRHPDYEIRCGMDPVSARFAQAWLLDKRHQVRVLLCDYRLTLAAQERVRIMRDTDVIEHDAGGVTENELARKYGYALPDWYEEKGNHIASLAAGSPSPQSLLDYVWESRTGHFPHVFGMNLDGSPSVFFLSHLRMGVGYLKGTSDSVYSHYWAIFTAPAEWGD